MVGRCEALEPGESILSVATREGIEIPTLCHDPRLEPAGACRSCLVEVDGDRRLQPACALQGSRDGMKVTTASPRIMRHRSVLAGTVPERFPVEDCGRDRTVRA